MFDLLRAVRELRIPHVTEGHHHCVRGWVQLHCPFCTDGTYGYHLGFSLISGAFACWRCGKREFRDTVARIFHLPDAASLARIISEYQTEKKDVSYEARNRSKALTLPRGCGPFLFAHKQYLRRRGFDPNMLARDWSVFGTDHLAGRWCRRIIAPIYDPKGRIVSFIGRAISSKQHPKYKLCPDNDALAPIKSILYGENKVETKQAVVIVEGPFDVWRLGPGAVALLGVSWGEEQADRLSQYERRYVIFDPDEAGRRKAAKLAEWLADAPGKTFIVDGLEADPSELSPKQAARLMKTLGLKTGL